MRYLARGTISIIVHNIRSAYNVGAIFRTADGMGANKIYLSGYTPSPSVSRAPYQSKAQKMIAKTALGAEKYISWEKVKDISALIKKLKKKGYLIAAIEQDEKSISCRKFQPRFPLVLIVGNEPKGIDRRILKICDKIVEIPMRGKKESLNVAVALGIVGFSISDSLEKE